MAAVGFIGLGVMGGPMAGHLAKKGHSVTVWNRTASKAQEWLGQYGEYSVDAATTIAELAAKVDVVVSCIGGDDDLRAIVKGGNTLADNLKATAIHIDHSTVSADCAREIAQHYQNYEIAFLDAPISGGQPGAENGVLTVMVGGEQQAFDATRALMDCYAKAVTLMGDSGAGQLTKMVNQICIAGLLQGLSEGMAFCEKAGLDGKKVVDVISKGAAQSWQMDNRALTMLDDQFDFGFAIDAMRKDLGFVLDEARRNGAHLPVTALVDQYYGMLQQRGNRGSDTSSLIRLLHD